LEDVCFVLFYLSAYIFQQDVLGLYSIAQNKATGTAKGDIRASQGGLYPTWSLMLAHILAGECFPFSFSLWMTKCEEGGIKKPHKCVSTKFEVHSTKARMYQDQGECHFGYFEFEKGV
jgi:hypothetical protein